MNGKKFLNFYWY